MKEKYEICPISLKIIRDGWIANFCFFLWEGELKALNFEEL